MTELGKRRLAKDVKRGRKLNEYAYNTLHAQARSLHGNKMDNLRKDFDNSSKEFREFWSKDNRELQDKYLTLAACVRSLDDGLDPSKSEDRQDIVRNVLGSVYDDFDQGIGNSFELYLLDKGISPHDYKAKYDKAEQAYLKEVESSVGEILGDYGSTVINKASFPFMKDSTVNSILADTIRNNDAQYAYLELDMSPSKEKYYRQLMKKAKKISKDYEKKSWRELHNLLD